MDPASATLEEIRTQTAAWEEAIRVTQAQTHQIAELELSSFDQAVFCGCGSTYYLSLSAAALFQSLARIYSRGVPSSEALLSPKSIYLDSHSRALFLAVSRSGTTTETLQAVHAFTKTHHGSIVTVTNYEDSPLAQSGQINICIPMGKEQSVAQTRSFASMLVACTTLSIMASQEREEENSLAKLTPAGEHLIRSYESLAQEMGQNHEIKRFFFLGSGYQYGLACEASLKMKEMSLSVSEPFHFLEFRHGPISMIDHDTLVIGLLSEERREYEQAVLLDVLKLGGRVITLGEAACET